MGVSWTRLESYSDTFTCYSAAIATWTAGERDDWLELIDPGLGLTVAPAADGLFRFAHLRPGLRAELSLVRAGSEDPLQAVGRVLAELERSDRVLVAGDAYNQPWHVAQGRRHAPHWFVLERDGDELTISDPFSFRSELGMHKPYRGRIEEAALPSLLRAVPQDDPVLALRESLAFGDESAPGAWQPHAWFMRAEVDGWRAPEGAHGPDAIRLLAAQFREHGHQLECYRQAEDLWAVGRHRTLLSRHMREVALRRGDEALSGWTTEHLEPLAHRWGHVAPLIMQATLALQSGRNASDSLSGTLDELATREEAAAKAVPPSHQLAKI